MDELTRRVERQVADIQPVLDRFVAACPAGCEHLADARAWTSGSTVHVDTHRGLSCGEVGCDAENCLVCFAKGA